MAELKSVSRVVLRPWVFWVLMMASTAWGYVVGRYIVS